MAERSRETQGNRLMKFVKGATSAPLVYVDEGGGFVDANWKQVDLIDPVDSGFILVSGIAEHTSKKAYQLDFRHHQVALILDGEMVVQNVDTGEVYRAGEGDLFYWAPGLRLRLGGLFRAFFVQTPVVRRWLRTPDGRKTTLYLGEPLEGEVPYQSSPPDEVRSESLEEA
ncbi:MAG: hypothetical protein ACE5JL_10800 [Dehalococcoidia bacterium]